MRYDFTLAGLVALTSLAWPLSNAKAMTFEQMKELLAAGVASDLVLEQYLAEPERFDPSSAQVLELKNAGATDALLRELISAKDSDVPHSTSRVTGDLDLYVDPFGYHVYSWPNAFAYYCPNPGWSYSLYYGGYCGWRFCAPNRCGGHNHANDLVGIIICYGVGRRLIEITGETACCIQSHWQPTTSCAGWWLF